MSYNTYESVEKVTRWEDEGNVGDHENHTGHVD